MTIREALVVASLLVASVGLGACSSDEGSETTGTACPTDLTLTYDNFGQVFFQENCLACHGALVHDLVGNARSDDDVSCVHCHAAVGHGETAGVGR
jgi:hypothetical protein